jgi:hypothetical protein
MNRNEKIALALKYLLVSIKKFYESDHVVFEEFKDDIKGMERPCAFRIGSYFREMVENDIANFFSYHVDMEYNRMGKTGDSKCMSHEHKENIIFPDMILHRRGEQDNILVCEFKAGAKENGDYKKLEALTAKKSEQSDNNVCDYNIGIFCRLEKELEKCRLTLFADGKILNEKELYETIRHSNGWADFNKAMLKPTKEKKRW